jgi:hypothetical protein
MNNRVTIANRTVRTVVLEVVTGAVREAHRQVVRFGGDDGGGVGIGGGGDGGDMADCTSVD